jgi:transcription initiation factor TFIIH subunit 2
MSAATTTTTTTAVGTDPTTSVSHAWEDNRSQNAWDQAVREDATGRIVVASGDTLAQAIRKRRKRLTQNDYAQRNRRVVRDMIRYVYVLIDVSRWMRVKDPVLPPGTRIDVTVAHLQHFVQEYYDQNPLSQLGFVLLKNGEAEILTQLSSSSKTHKLALDSVAQMAAAEGPSGGGEFSLQNGLELAGRSLGHQPSHGSREIVLVTAALSTCDPGYLLTETLPRLRQAQIRVSCLALNAELHVCRKLADETHGVLGVCLDRAHLRDWLRSQTVPPPTLPSRPHGCALVRMGFPTRIIADGPEFVHATRQQTVLARTAYTCPVCQAKNAALPADCAVCGLQLVLAPHLARSFHHLFPVPPFREVQPDTAVVSNSQVPVVASSAPVVVLASTPLPVASSQQPPPECAACLRPFSGDGVSDDTEGQLRFACPDCHQVFCVDCDAFLHESLHNCPGCLCR